MTVEYLKFCKNRGIQYTLDDDLKNFIHPNLYIDNIEECPNPLFKYRDYQTGLISALCKAGRGIILSPTRSGKSLILGRIIS